MDTRDELPGSVDSSIRVPGLPLPLFVTGGLYWIRWWVLRPEQPLLNRWRKVQRSSTLER